MPDISNLVTCGTCGYPHSDDGMGCPNPACFANPCMKESTKTMMRAENELRKADEADRENMRRVRAWAAGR